MYDPYLEEVEGCFKDNGVELESLSMRRHVEHGNDDINEVLKVLDRVEAKSDDVDDMGGAY